MLSIPHNKLSCHNKDIAYNEDIMNNNTAEMISMNDQIDNNAINIQINADLLDQFHTSKSIT